MEGLDPDPVAFLHGRLGPAWVFPHHLLFPIIISGLGLAFGIELSRMRTKAGAVVIGMCVRGGPEAVRVFSGISGSSRGSVSIPFVSFSSLN